MRTFVLVTVSILAGCSQDPSTSSSSTAEHAATTAHVGDTVGYFTIQKINAGSVDGLYRYPYPVAYGEGEPKTLRVGDEVGAACEGRTYTLAAIDAAGQSVTFRNNTHEPSPGGCPICLSGDTMIDTPDGPVNVKDLRIGTQIWALHGGQKQVLPIEKVSRTLADDHHVVHLVLADGRSLDASPGHPLADGRPIGVLRVGDVVDRSNVVAAGLVSYRQDYTYDLLVGEGYWANGILVASTLR